MSNKIGIIYTFTRESFYNLCEKLYIPENERVCPNKHEVNTDDNFCRYCGAPTKTVSKTLTRDELVEYVWETEFDGCGFWAITDVNTDNEFVKIIFSEFDHDDGEITLDEISNMCCNFESDMSDFAKVLDNFCNTKQYGFCAFDY